MREARVDPDVVPGIKHVRATVAGQTVALPFDKTGTGKNAGDIFSVVLPNDIQTLKREGVAFEVEVLGKATIHLQPAGCLWRPEYAYLTKKPL